MQVLLIFIVYSKDKSDDKFVCELFVEIIDIETWEDDCDDDKDRKDGKGRKDGKKDDKNRKLLFSEGGVTMNISLRTSNAICMWYLSIPGFEVAENNMVNKNKHVTTTLLGTCQIDQDRSHEWRSVECVGLGEAISNVTLEP
ncbi:hypothetical protein EV421DRAFT_1743513 [Armillaria borealis]|uniref:Uncharacterized protein n=1 Tax=Armillaria borealis TaxID=47425 RepID=A0AA39IXL4_9AGAR|nr:hypothetical protein EV421DRAFT_1743513 [Armillaria borealis]